MYSPELKPAIETAKAFGFMSEGEVEALYDLALRFSVISDPVFVNVGAGAGTSGLALRAGCPRAKIYTVDCSPDGPLGGLKGERNKFSEYNMELPTQILGESHTVAKSWNHGLIDLAFIDDGHTEPYIRGDIEGWFPLVKKESGVMVFHDYGHDYWPDVKVVVDEFMGKFTTIIQERYLIAFLLETKHE